MSDRLSRRRGSKGRRERTRMRRWYRESGLLGMIRGVDLASGPDRTVVMARDSSELWQELDDVRAARAIDEAFTRLSKRLQS